MLSSKSEATLRRDARAICGAALDAVEPARLVAKALAPASEGPTAATEIAGQIDGELVVAGFGKAAAAMARGVDRVLGPRVTRGVLVVPRGADPGLPAAYRVLAGGHPRADDDSARGAWAVRALARTAGPSDLLIALISGGGSSLLALPPAGVRLGDIGAVTEALSRAGMSIHTLNTVRKHLDQLKGGRLALEVAPARTLALILSDVPGNPVDVVASGPLAADPTTFAEALAHVDDLRGLGDPVPESVARHLARGVRGEIDESPAREHPCFDRVTSVVVGSGATAAAAACDAARRLGYAVEAGPTSVGGEAREVATSLAVWIRRHLDDGPVCRISAGEPTVRVRGQGAGGRNQQLVLEAAQALEGLPALLGSLATDGVDGPTAAAGALVTGTTAARARAAGFDLRARLRDNDAHPVLSGLDDLIVTGPTGTNVADIQLALVG